MTITVLPLLAGVVPWSAVMLAYWLGVEAGHLPACFPYVDGCTSISATGRHPPGSFVFKPAQLLFAAALSLLWYLVAEWLRTLQDKETKRVERWIVGLGLVGAIALVIYTTFLGTEGPLYEFMRRFGIYAYFAGTVFAQLLTSISVRGYSICEPEAGLSHIARWMVLFALMPFALGILNLMLKAVLADPDTFQNRIEWIAALMMQAWFVLLYFSWRITGYRVRTTKGSTNAHR